MRDITGPDYVWTGGDALLCKQKNHTPPAWDAGPEFWNYADNT